MNEQNKSFNFNEMMGKNNQMRSLRFVIPGWLALFSPAVFLILLAAAIIFAPKLVMFVVSSILIFFGIIFAFLAYKLIKFKSKIQDIRKNFKARVFVNNADVDSGFGTSFQELMDSFPEVDADNLLQTENISAEDIQDFLSEEENVTQIKSKDGKLIEVVNGKKIVFH